MSDTENAPGVESPEIPDGEKEVAKKKAVPARGQMTEKKKQNLAAAHQAKAAKRLSQYPKGEKSDAAAERYEQQVREEAEKRAKDLAKELLEKEKLERELSKFRAWKATQAKDETTAKPAAKKSKKNNDATAQLAVKKAPAKAKRARNVLELSEDGDQESYISTPSHRRHSAPAYDPLAGLLD